MKGLVEWIFSVSATSKIQIATGRMCSQPWCLLVYSLKTVLILGATCYLMFHELTAFIRIRQENLTSEEHKYTVRATTILVTSVPDNFLNEQTLRQMFSVFPGGVKNVFLNRDCSELLDKIENRDNISR